MAILQPGANAPFGFLPSENHGTPAPTHAYNVSTSFATLIAIGDVIVATTGPYVAVPTVGTTALGDTGVQAIIGVAAESKAAAAGGSLLVWDDPDQVFVVCDQGSATAGYGATGAAIAIGSAFNFNATATGTDLRSGMTLKSTAPVAGGPIRVVGLHPIETGMPTSSGDFRRWNVKFYKHLLNNSVGVV